MMQSSRFSHGLVPFVAIVSIYVEGVSATPPATEPGAKYVEVTIKGDFGSSIVPIGLKKIVASAKAAGATVFILRVDSPGGDVQAARKTMRVLSEEGKGMVVVAAVTDAYSAAIWPLGCCERIFVKPTSKIGAATIYTHDKSTGSIDVDAKLNSGFAAEIAAEHESRGRSALLIRAMIIKDVEVYAVCSEKGAVTLSPVRPVLTKGERVDVVDSADSILTLTGSEATRLGFASMAGGLSSDEILDAMGLSGASRIMPSAQEVIDYHGRRATLWQNELTKISRQLNDGIERLGQLNPRKGQYEVNTLTRKFTATGFAQWQGACNKYIDTCKEVRIVAVKLDEHMRVAVQWGIDWLDVETQRAGRKSQHTVDIDKLMAEMEGIKNTTLGIP